MELEFDWDDANIAHLRRHRITPREFLEVLLNDPLELEYQNEDGEDRFKSLGVTRRGRVLVAVWSVRDERIRAVTAYPATRKLKNLYLKMQGIQ